MQHKRRICRLLPTIAVYAHTDISPAWPARHIPFLPGLPSEVETGHLGCSEIEAPNCRLLLPFSEELDGNIASYSEEAAKLGMNSVRHCDKIFKGKVTIIVIHIFDAPSLIPIEYGVLYARYKASPLDSVQKIYDEPHA